MMLVRKNRCVILFTGSLFLRILLVHILASISHVSSIDAQQDDVVKRSMSSTGDKDHVAVVTLLTSASYVPGAEVLVESLNRVQAKGDRVLMYVPQTEDERSGITDEHLYDLRLAGWEVLIPLTRANGKFVPCKITDEQEKKINKMEKEYDPGTFKVSRYWGTCCKIAIWTLEQYDSIIYIDADGIAFKNFDHLYDVIDQSKNIILGAQTVQPCEEGYVLRKESGFYTSFLAIKPLKHIFQFLRTTFDKNTSPRGEIELINEIFQSLYVFPKFVSTVQTDQNRPFIKEKSKESGIESTTNAVDWDKVYSYDFTGATKPWDIYWKQKELGNPLYHPNLKGMDPDSKLYHIYMPPFLKWYDLYEAVLERKIKARENREGDEL